MHYLNNSNIEQLSDHLKSEEINYSHLFDDLLDHLCCEVESKMEGGLDFTSAFNSIKHTIGNNGLKDIQDATIFYVKLNLLVMKKTIKILGITASILMIVGLLFKTMHWPGANLLIAVGTLILLAGFTPFALFSLKRDDNLKLFSGKFILYFLGFICLFETGLALLFKFNNWAGGSALVLLSWVLIMVVLFPLIFVYILKFSQKKLIPLTLLLFSFLLFGMTTTYSFNRKVFKGNIYRYTVTDLNEEISYYSYKAKKLEQNIQELDNKSSSLSNKLNSNIHELDKLMEELLGEAESISEINSKYIKTRNDIEKYYNQLKELSGGVQSYAADAVAIVNDPMFTELVEQKLMAFKTDSGSMHYLGWFNLNFIQAGCVDSYNNLNRIKKDLLQVHCEVLQHLKDQKKS